MHSEVVEYDLSATSLFKRPTSIGVNTITEVPRYSHMKSKPTLNIISMVIR